MKTTQDARIFIVDDDPFWIQLFRELLESMGYRNIHSFEAGQECIDNLKLNPDIIFLDYEMGNIDGLSVLKSVKDYYDGVYVIFTTGKEDLNVAVNAMKNGSFDYLLKTNVSRKHVQKLFGKIEESLRRHDRVI